MNIKTLWQLLKDTVSEWQADDASRLAAALSFYTTISIAPLLVIVVLVAGFLLGDQASRNDIVNQVQNTIGSNAAGIIEMIGENMERPNFGNIAGLLTILALLWSSSNVFSQLQQSLNVIMDVQAAPNVGIGRTIRKRLLSFAMVLVIAFLLLVSLVLNTVLTLLTSSFGYLLPGMDWLWQAGNFSLSFILITLLFAAMYKVLPDVKLAWGDVWIGAAVTSLLFTIGKWLIGLYLGNQAAASMYGAAGSLFIFLIWVFYSAQILMFGAEFTQVYARQFGSGAPPAENAVRVVRRPPTSDAARETAS